MKKVKVIKSLTCHLITPSLADTNTNLKSDKIIIIQNDINPTMLLYKQMNKVFVRISPAVLLLQDYLPVPPLACRLPIPDVYAVTPGLSPLPSAQPTHVSEPQPPAAQRLRRVGREGDDNNIMYKRRLVSDMW